MPHKQPPCDPRHHEKLQRCWLCDWERPKLQPYYEFTWVPITLGKPTTFIQALDNLRQEIVPIVHGRVSEYWRQCHEDRLGLILSCELGRTVRVTLDWDFDRRILNAEAI
jgi:hypothetical protein